MTPQSKKLWLYGGGAAALTLLVYFIFFNKPDKQTPDKKTRIDEPPVPAPDKQEIPNIVKSRSGTRLRQEPSTSSSIIKTLSSGVRLDVSDSKEMEDGTWYSVSAYIGGDFPTFGWVRSDVVDEVK
jgi:hypothetical protein